MKVEVCENEGGGSRVVVRKRRRMEGNNGDIVLGVCVECEENLI